MDNRLAKAINAAEQIFGPEAHTDRYRGLYINRDEVDRLLTQLPGDPLFSTNGQVPDDTVDNSDIAEHTLPFDWLQAAYALSDFDLDVILIALAPELDRRYERIYAYLQDHVSRRRPTVDLVLHLLCADAGERLAQRDHFAPKAPLIRQGLIQLMTPAEATEPTLLAQGLKLDEQVIHLLLGDPQLDARLVPFCQDWTPPVFWSVSPLGDERQQQLSSLVEQAWAMGQPLRLYFQGPAGVGKRQVAWELAAEIGVELLVVDLAAVLAASADFEAVVKRLYRQAWYQGAVLYFNGLDNILQPDQTLAYRTLLRALATDAGITILAGAEPWAPLTETPIGVIQVPFERPGFGQRCQYWLDALSQANMTLSAPDLDALAGRFRLTPAQIAEAVATVEPWQGVTEPLAVSKLFTAARRQSGQALATLARKLEPTYDWDDLVLPPDAVTQLHELCQRVAHRHQVLDSWGFDRKLSLGKGVNALFAGPSGTGKTMAAEVIAQDLGLDLYKIDLSGVVSKYIGETEKNLNRIFRAAENANAILFFDEADALFGKRSEVRDSHDRYANLEVSYLLQKMEEYEGLSILATNLNRNMDEAFVRRLTFTVTFPFPNEESRLAIWRKIWPEQAPLATDVNLAFMAQEFKLAGGSIKNIALAAAFLAVEAGGRH